MKIAPILVAAASALLLSMAPVRAATPVCDGEPPLLINDDKVDHSYQITCGSKISKGAVKAGNRVKLEGKSGCTLQVGETKTKLFTEMVCTIDKGTLSCDLM